MKLVAITRELASRPEIAASDFLSGLCASTLAMYPNGQAEAPWTGYLAKEQGVFKGTCAFKSPPTQGEVEIAYFTFPDHEGSGIATSMARQLVEIARQHGILKVKAHTLPAKSASTSILEKLGFVFSCSTIHPEDGNVWEWHRSESA